MQKHYEMENGTPRDPRDKNGQTTRKKGGRWEWIISICCLWVLVILLALSILALSISKLAMGVIYFNDCPIQSMIPIYLIISACSVLTLIGFYRLMPEDGETKVFQERLNVGTIIGLLGLLFIFVWLICGSVWVFGNYNDVMAGCGDSTVCCDTNLIQFSLVIIVIDWIFIGLALVTIVATCLLILCCGRNNN